MVFLARGTQLDFGKTLAMRLREAITKHGLRCGVSVSYLIEGKSHSYSSALAFSSLQFLSGGKPWWELPPKALRTLLFTYLLTGDPSLAIPQLGSPDFRQSLPELRGKR